ncbi:hypothetical protein FVD15_03430 [Campylobacter volucris]|uniref:Uncharacterized protein n=1 Tax=Campylobacter volucris TaxID=1031542 RepID=A0AAE5YHP7_9BACT|nr:hypothetical protein [Campylobacter volucris]AJC94141.1 hypothetical protein CVOL_0834 [Campylobacter volucris LMG 24379]KAB0580299.1 hypothetical protein F7P61_01445 [Campylobacter volucris]QBL13487.1 hypothetical protein A9460_03740 [Campylobacter volucris]QEL08357.1 hypothetical protein CVOLT_0841 [Campylobacter volucris]TXK70524.1 hypothetical protein FVD15_03430 [Campylobacter volucris]
MKSILEEISKNAKELNKEFDESLNILKDLYKNGLKLDDEQVKKNILEILENGNYKGEKGDTGAKGEDGQSAYELWLSKEANAGKSEDEFLASLKGEGVSKEELQPIVEEIVSNLPQKDAGFITSYELPNPDIKAEVGTLINYVNEEASTIYLCIRNQGKGSVWLDLFSKKKLANEEYTKIKFKVRTLSGQYGGCLSDVLFAFSNGFAHTVKLDESLSTNYDEGNFIIQKSGLGGTSNAAQPQRIDCLSQVLAKDEVLGKIKTNGIYRSTHNIHQSLMRYFNFDNTSAVGADWTTCCLWNSNGEYEVQIILFNEEVPNKFFARGTGYYGQVYIHSLSVEKIIAKADVIKEIIPYEVQVLPPFGTAKESQNHAGYIFDDYYKAYYQSNTHSNDEQNNLFSNYGQFANLFLITPKGE